MYQAPDGLQVQPVRATDVPELAGNTSVKLPCVTGLHASCQACMGSLGVQVLAGMCAEKNEPSVASGCLHCQCLMANATDAEHLLCLNIVGSQCQHGWQCRSARSRTFPEAKCTGVLGKLQAWLQTGMLACMTSLQLMRGSEAMQPTTTQGNVSSSHCQLATPSSVQSRAFHECVLAR